MKSRNVHALESFTEDTQGVDFVCLVMQCSPCRSIQRNNGSSVNLSSLLVGDSSKVYFKVTLWDNEAKWVHGSKSCIQVGDIVYFSGFRIRHFNQKFEASSSWSSKRSILFRQSDNSFAQIGEKIPLSLWQPLLSWAVKAYPSLLGQAHSYGICYISRPVLP